MEFCSVCLYMKHQVQCSAFGSGTFHSTLLKPKGTLQINDSTNLPKDFLILWPGNCRMWRSDWWELFWYCSNELSAQINMTNCFTKGKKIGNKSQLKADEHKLDYVILISQTECNMKLVNYLSVPQTIWQLQIISGKKQNLGITACLAKIYSI